jgi:hypothetical protein
MSFNESNTVEQMILDALAPTRSGEPLALHEDLPGWGGSLAKDIPAGAPRPV